MNCKIKWNALELKDWEERFASIPRSSLLQSYDYARAICQIYRQRARWGVIEINGAEAGLVQIFEAGILKGALHAVMCDRAPLWFDGFGSVEHFEAFTAALAQEFPRRLGRKRRFIPEIETSPKVTEIIKSKGFKPSTGKAYQTIWVDLRADEEQIFASIKKNQRGAIKKAQKADLSVDWDDEGAQLSWLLKHYAADQKLKKYDGASRHVIRALAATHMTSGKMLIARALVKGEAIAAIMIMCHGKSATYQIGWTSDQGRKTAAHPYLLWEAYKMLKARGITDFDLGGVNEDSAAGVKKFKQAMGGSLETLSGLYT